MKEQQQQTAEAVAVRGRVRAVIGALVGQELTAGGDELSLAELAPGRYDSLGVIEAVALVERELGVSIALVEDDLRATFYSVAAIATLVARKQHDAAVLGGQW